MHAQQPAQEGELRDRGRTCDSQSAARTACIPSRTETPMPTCASWIIETSLAPSPMASVSGGGEEAAVTMRTTSAFCLGETRHATMLEQSRTIERKRPSSSES